MNVSIDREDIEEIERNYDKLTKFLTTNYVNIGACAIILQAVIDRVEELKAMFKGEETE